MRWWLENKGRAQSVDGEYAPEFFGVQEAVYVRRLPHYGWLRRDINHEKSDMGMEVRAILPSASSSPPARIFDTVMYNSFVLNPNAQL